jgi:transposase
LKEDLKREWRQSSHEAGEACLTAWIGKAMSSGVSSLFRLGRTVRKHAAGIMNCFRHGITTASLESFNSKLKVIIGRARGYRNMGNFKRMILATREFNPANLFS